MKENSIEEDIEIIESIIEEYENCSVPEIDMQVNVIFREKQNNALNHILSDYKRVLKENEILKDEKTEAWQEWNNLEQGSYETEQKLKQQIKQLQKENEELKFEKRRTIIGKYGDAEIHEVINKTLSNDYISVQKIKDKIEILKKVKENNIKRNFDTVYKDGYFTGGIDSLRELLREE